MISKNLTNDEFATMLSRFSPLKNWLVAVSYGSTIRVELGKRLEEPRKRGGVYERGSATVWVEGDNWEFLKRDVVLVTSEIVGREHESLLNAELNDALFIGAVWDENSRLFTLLFSGDKRFQILPADKRGDDYDDLASIFLPNGDIVCCMDIGGLYLSSDIDGFLKPLYERA